MSGQYLNIELFEAQNSLQSVDRSSHLEPLRFLDLEVIEGLFPSDRKVVSAFPLLPVTTCPSIAAGDGCYLVNPYKYLFSFRIGLSRVSPRTKVEFARL